MPLFLAGLLMNLWISVKNVQILWSFDLIIDILLNKETYMLTAIKLYYITPN